MKKSFPILCLEYFNTGVKLKIFQIIVVFWNNSGFNDVDWFKNIIGLRIIDMYKLKWFGKILKNTYIN